jgi:hypothetical protein
MRATRGQLQLRAGPRHREEDAVVAVVADEAPELGETHSVAVERPQRFQLVGVTRHPQLHAADHGITTSVGLRTSLPLLRGQRVIR